MKEENNLVSRVKRYSKVTTSMTSLATKFAGKKYLNFDLNDQKYAAQITEILGNLKGPLMKVAQLSATIPDLLPEEYARKLRVNMVTILLAKILMLGKHLNL